jgi:uncharacterized membrane protein (TIGR02234 family)
MLSTGPSVTSIGCAVASAVALFAVTRTWVVETVQRPAPLPPVVTAYQGSGVLRALALVALAGAGGLLAARGPGRRVVAGLLVACGGAIAVLAATSLGRSGVAVGWVLLTVVAGVAIGAAGGVGLRFGAAWPGLGTRYERPAADERLPRSDRVDGPDRPDRAVASQALWDAIERGEDPTKS